MHHLHVVQETLLEIYMSRFLHLPSLMCTLNNSAPEFICPVENVPRSDDGRTCMRNKNLRVVLFLGRQEDTHDEVLLPQ